MSESKQVSVAIEDGFLSRLGEVWRDLALNGMAIEQELDAVGVILGSIDEDRIAALRTVAGVREVELVGEISVF
jgi:hypothetical protein